MAAGQGSGRWRSGGRTTWEFLVYLVQRFMADECLPHAATLAYTTLLSVVPLLTVGFSILAAFPVFDTINANIHEFIFRNMVPAASAALQDSIAGFIDKASGLTALGTVGLIGSALLMMSAIDKALNDIWRVTNRRRPVQGFLVYWSVLTLSPVLLGASLAVSSYLLTEWGDLLGISAVKQGLLAVLPFLAEWTAFTFLYTAVPNRRVPMRDALIGAFVAAVLFELAKAGFAVYVSSVPAYEVIYGAIAAVPLFLVWLYVSWVVVLLGAQFTQALGGFPEHRRGGLSDPRQLMILAVRLLGHLWRGQRRGRPLTRAQLRQREPRAGDLAIQQALDAMERAALVVRTARGAWTLVRDPHRYTLLQLYRGGRFVLPEPRQADGADAWDHRLGAALAEAQQGLERAFACTLAELLAEEAAESEEES